MESWWTENDFFSFFLFGCKPFYPSWAFIIIFKTAGSLVGISILIVFIVKCSIFCLNFKSSVNMGASKATRTLFHGGFVIFNCIRRR